MTLYKNRYRVESARHPTWDYHSQGCYFVTICTHDRNHYFGRISDHQMKLTPIGEIAVDELLKTPEIRDNVVIDEWVVMPNHVHVIYRILPPSPPETTHRGASQPTENDRGASQPTKNDRGASQPSKNDRGASQPTKNDRGGTPKETHRGASLQPTQTQSSQKNQFGPQSNNLASIVRGFKSAVKRQANNLGIEFNWQPGYHDRIIRDDNALQRIRTYIRQNIIKWQAIAADR
jgi:putative transposase